MDYATLKSALEGDQVLLDLLSKGADGKLADALNTIDDKINIDRTMLPRDLVLVAMRYDDYKSLEQVSRDYLALILLENLIEVSSLVQVFVNTPTGDAYLALGTRKGSKAEQLFGAGTIISDRDIIAARKA